MKNYKVLGEGPHHIEVQHADGTTMKIAKAHLDMKMMAKLASMPRVKHLADGGDVDPSDPNGTANPPLQGGGAEQTDLPPSNPLGTASLIGDSAPSPTGPAIDQTSGAPLADAENPGDAAPVGQQVFPTPSGQPPDAPQNPAGMPNMMGGLSGQIEKDVSDAKAANIAKAQAEGQMAQDTYKIQNDTTTKLQAADLARQQKITALDTEGKTLTDNIANSKIDPNHYWNNSDTGAKVGMLAGLVLSGIGSGMTGQASQALAVMQKNIDRDIEAQQANLGTQKTLLEANMRKYGNLEQATAATRLNLISVAQGQINAAAAKQGTPMAMANAKMANAQLDQAAMPNRIAIARWQAGNQQLANDQAGGAAAGGGYNLDKLTALKYQASMGASPYQKEDLDTAGKEYGTYAGATTGLQNVLSQFDAMSKTKGGMMTTEPGWVPDVARDKNSQSYDASKSAISAETSKVFGEKPSIALMAEVDPLFPKAGDSPATLAEKRGQIENVFKKAAIDKAGGFEASKRMRLISPSDPLLNVIQPSK